MNQADITKLAPTPVNTARVRLADVEHRMRDLLAAGTPDIAARLAMRHLSDGGGRSRARTAVSAGQSLGLRHGAIIAIAAASELLHNASLVHDDIQDASDERRGQPSLRKTHGDNIALCVGDLFIFRAFEALAGPGNSDHLSAQIQAMSKASATAVRGQLADLSPHSPSSLQAYEQLAVEKSGALLFLPLQLCLLAAGRRAEAWLGPARRAMQAIAIAYQASDDLADCAEDASTQNAANANLVDLMQMLGAHEPQRAVCEHARLRLGEASQHASQLPDALRQLIEQAVLQLNARLLT